MKKDFSWWCSMIVLFALLIALLIVAFSAAYKLFTITEIILYSIMGIIGMIAAMMWVWEVVNYDK
jgi:NhaP-type Na+/H+ or K+/H+ antiporter